jgi:hypothetical protein
LIADRGGGYLVGISRDFFDPDGKQMYVRRQRTVALNCAEGEAPSLASYVEVVCVNVGGTGVRRCIQPRICLSPAILRLIGMAQLLHRIGPL